LTAEGNKINDLMALSADRTTNPEAKLKKAKSHRFESKGKESNQSISRETSFSKLSCLSLKKEKEKFYGIANSIREGIILVDEETTVAYWNPAAEKMFGYTSKEACGKDVHKLVVPKAMFNEGKERIKTGVKTFSATGAGYFTFGNVQMVGLRKDGSEFPVELSVSPVRLGGKWNAVGVVKDITERKRTEEMLKEAEQRYHALFDQAPIGVLIVDPETAAFVEFNDYASRQLGYSRENFEKLTIPDIEAKESKAEVWLHIAKMVKDGGGEFETLHRANDRTVKNTLVSTKTIKLAGKTFLHCIFHDISEIRLAQKALMESETQYRQLVELAQEGVWLLDNDYVTTFVNPRMAQMLGYVESEMMGKSLLDFIDKGVANLESEFSTESKQGLSGNFECGFVRKDGTHVYTSIAASLVKDDKGNYSGTLALVADITLRKEMENKLEKYSKRLEDIVEQRTKDLAKAQAQLIKSERLAAIGELAGMVGHDLRNPLTGIKNAAYLLKRKNAFPNAQSKEMLEIIDHCVDHSNKIINDLLDYSREIQLEKEDYSPRQLLSDALAMVSIPEKIRVDNKLTDTPSLSVDIDKMTRIFINLVKNAIDAMPNGGTITIDYLLAIDHLEISVADTGMGIPEDVLPKIFLPLFTTKAQGMGFGLAICKRIIEAHGGGITVKTAKGVGTTFTITIPTGPKVNSGGEKTWIDQEYSLLMTIKQ